MYTYIYFYKNDPNRESIGRIKADTLQEAKHYITIIKNLSEESIEKLLVIQKLD